MLELKKSKAFSSLVNGVLIFQFWPGNHLVSASDSRKTIRSPEVRLRTSLLTKALNRSSLVTSRPSIHFPLSWRCHIG